MRTDNFTALQICVLELYGSASDLSAELTVPIPNLGVRDKKDFPWYLVLELWPVFLLTTEAAQRGAVVAILAPHREDIQTNSKCCFYRAGHPLDPYTDLSPLSVLGLCTALPNVLKSRVSPRTVWRWEDVREMGSNDSMHRLRPSHPAVSTMPHLCLL